MTTIRNETDRRFVWKLGQLWGIFLSSKTVEERRMILDQIEAYAQSWFNLENDHEFREDGTPTRYTALLGEPYVPVEDEGLVIALTSIPAHEMEADPEYA